MGWSAARKMFITKTLQTHNLCNYVMLGKKKLIRCDSQAVTIAMQRGVSSPTGLVGEVEKSALIME